MLGIPTDFRFNVKGATRTKGEAVNIDGGSTTATETAETEGAEGAGLRAAVAGVAVAGANFGAGARGEEAAGT